MTRLRMLTAEEFSPELRQLVAPDGQAGLELGPMRIHAQRPELAVALASLRASLGANRTLSERLLELVRLRVAYCNQCRSCMAIRYSRAIEDGLTESLVCSLEHPEEADDLTEAERAAIRFGEMMATDHMAIDDTTYEMLRQHFSEEQIVELGINVAVFVGFGRLAATWKMTDDLPDRFRDDEVVTPWGGDAVVLGGGTNPPRPAGDGGASAGRG